MYQSSLVDLYQVEISRDASTTYTMYKIPFLLDEFVHIVYQQVLDITAVQGSYHLHISFSDRIKPGLDVSVNGQVPYSGSSVDVFTEVEMILLVLPHMIILSMSELKGKRSRSLCVANSYWESDSLEGMGGGQ